MSGANRNQNSGSRNSIGEDVPLTVVTPTRDQDDNQIQGQGQGTNRAQNSSTGDGNDGTKKNATDNSGDGLYNPESAITNNTAILDDVPEGFNVYRNKKTLTQGLMDIALFSANANQLRYILDHASKTYIFYIAAALIIISLILQIGVGLLLLLSTRYTLTVACQRELAYKYGNYVVMGIFLITVVNIFIAAFGGPAVSIPAATVSVGAAAPAISSASIANTLR